MSDSSVKDSMQGIGKVIESKLPKEFGFFVFVFPFNSQDGRSNYCSNAERKDVINAMKEFLIQGGHEEDWMKHL